MLDIASIAMLEMLGGQTDVNKIPFVQDGLRFTYFWIKEQIEKEKTQGVDIAAYGSSKVVSTQAPVQLGSLRAADGKEGL